MAKASKPKRVALYLRVSTSEQTTRNQRRERHIFLRPVAVCTGIAQPVTGSRCGSFHDQVTEASGVLNVENSRVG